MENYPQYRKLEGFQRYYRISDARTFTEAVVMNGKVSYQTVEATQYPEMLRIKDMLQQEWNYREMDASEIAQYFGESELDSSKR